MLGTIKVKKPNGKTITVNSQINKNPKILIYTTGILRINDRYCYWRFVVEENGKIIFTNRGKISVKKDKNSYMLAQLIAMYIALEYVLLNFPQANVEIINHYNYAVDLINGKEKSYIDGKQKFHSRQLKSYRDKAKNLLSKINAVVKWTPKSKMELGH